MHVTKNLCVNLLGFLGVYGKTKDTPEAREEHQRVHEKDGMHPKQYEGPASYALTTLVENRPFVPSISPGLVTSRY